MRHEQLRWKRRVINYNHHHHHQDCQTLNGEKRQSMDDRVGLEYYKKSSLLENVIKRW